MASLQKRKRANGTAWLVQFMLQGARKSVFLDTNYTETVAKDVKGFIEKCVACIESDTPLDGRTKSWLDSTNDDLKQRLAASGLIKIKRQYTLRELIDLYMEKNESRLAEKTVILKRERFKRVYKYVDPSRLVSSLTTLEMNDVFQKMEERYSDASRAGTLSILRTVFNWALSQELIQKSPVAGIKPFRCDNRDREHFVSREDYEKIMASCLKQDHRTAICLYRIGGLRRTEAQLLRWEDVDFEQRRIKVLSPKTARCGKGYRIIPMFPELYEELSRQPHYSERVLLSKSYTHYYAMLKRIVERAGLSAWPRLLQNLRTSRAIEINRDFGWIPESEWLGHTQDVAKNHYLRAIQADFDKAVAGMVENMAKA